MAQTPAESNGLLRSTFCRSLLLKVLACLFGREAISNLDFRCRLVNLGQPFRSKKMIQIRGFSLGSAPLRFRVDPFIEPHLPHGVVLRLFV
jgi:hypothetical protein